MSKIVNDLKDGELNIRIARLLSGEEILGVFKEETDSVIVLENAVSFNVGLNPQTKQPSVSFGPVAPFAVASDKSSLPLNKGIVAFTYEPLEQIQTNFRSFLSGLVLPSGPTILTE